MQHDAARQSIVRLPAQSCAKHHSHVPALVQALSTLGLITTPLATQLRRTLVTALPRVRHKYMTGALGALAHSHLWGRHVLLPQSLVLLAAEPRPYERESPSSGADELLAAISFLASNARAMRHGVTERLGHRAAHLLQLPQVSAPRKVLLLATFARGGWAMPMTLRTVAESYLRAELSAAELPSGKPQVAAFVCAHMRLALSSDEQRRLEAQLAAAAPEMPEHNVCEALLSLATLYATRCLAREPDIAPLLQALQGNASLTFLVAKQVRLPASFAS